jgi:hypothetical protein
MPRREVRGPMGKHHHGSTRGLRSHGRRHLAVGRGRTASSPRSGRLRRRAPQPGARSALVGGTAGVRRVRADAAHRPRESRSRQAAGRDGRSAEAGAQAARRRASFLDALRTRRSGDPPRAAHHEHRANPPGPGGNRGADREIGRRGGGEAPHLNEPFGPFTLDGFWAEAKLVLEIDAFETHGTAHPFEADRRKDAYTASHGLRTIRVTPKRWRHDARRLEADIRRALAHR